MATSQAKLTADTNFWKQELEVQQQAYLFIKEFKRMKPYDFFKIQPDVYDMRKDMEGKDRAGPAGADSPRKKKVEDETDKKKKRG